MLLQPIFLSLLPVFLVLGTLLGLTLSGATSAANTVTTNSTTPSVSVNINSTSTADATVTNTGSNTTTTSLLPVFVFTNGTFAVPLVSFFNPLNLFQFGGLVIGRSFNALTSGLEVLVHEFLCFLLLGSVDCSEDEERNFVFMDYDNEPLILNFP